MTVVHVGSKKFELQLPSNSTVSDLCEAIEKETQLPVHCQRVVYNGRALNKQKVDLVKGLQTLGLKSPAKILVLGKRADEEDENHQMMKKWEDLCESVSKQLSSFHDEIQDMEKVMINNKLYQLFTIIYFFRCRDLRPINF